MKQLRFIFSLFVFGLSLFVTGVCLIDNNAMRQDNERMKNTLAEMIGRQLQAEAELRQVRTDAEIIYRIAITGEFEERE